MHPEQKSALAPAWRVGGELTWYWITRGRRAEGRHWIEALLAREVDVATLADLPPDAFKRGKAGLLFVRGGAFRWHSPEARPFWEQSLRLYREIGDRERMGQVLWYLVNLVIALGDMAAGQTLGEEYLAISEESHDTLGLVNVLGFFLVMAKRKGNPAQAQTLMQQALATARQVDDPYKRVYAVLYIATTLANELDFAAVAAIWEEGGCIARDNGFLEEMGYALCGLGQAAYAQGNFGAARRFYRQALVPRVSGPLSGLLVGMLHALFAAYQLLHARASALEAAWRGRTRRPFVHNPRIITAEWALLQGERPRHAGSNARLGAHGSRIRLPIVRITTDDGARGFGVSHVAAPQAATLVGMQLDDLFATEQGVREPWRAFEYPIWDLVGQRAGRPVYSLAAAVTGQVVAEPLRAPCYDTSLYFDDLHLDSDETATALMAAEAREGYERGHRAFKIKVGRGARHLPLEEGIRRDIAVVRAVRVALGAEPQIMLDANNGYNLNLAKRVLAETAGCGIFWFEEPFHEDDVLYQDLRAWLAQQGLPVLLADGEGQADPRLINWACHGLIDVVQCDIFSYGLSRWLHLGRTLDAAGVRSAPHHYGAHYGNYAACHLAGAIRGFTYVEWDEAATEGLDTSAYTIHEGLVSVPSRPGFGLVLDEQLFEQAVERTGARFGL